MNLSKLFLILLYNLHSVIKKFNDMKTVNLELEEGEEARPIKDFEWYLVTSFGRVFSLKRGIFLKSWVSNTGYLRVLLHGDCQAKNKSVHRLVAQAFLPDYSEDLQVNHLDENKLNNHVSNLAMCSHKENCNYGTHTQRSAEKRRNDPKRSKKVLCLTNGVIYPSIMEASRQLNLNNRHISECCLGKRKQVGGFQFKFV